MSKLSLADKAFETIKTAIANNYFKPGDKLSICELSERFQIGQSPLREALARLSAVEVIECEAMKGYRVPTINLAEFDDLYRARSVLTPELAKLIIQNVTDQWEGELIGAQHQLKKIELRAEGAQSFDEWQKYHTAFVSKLIEGCRSPTLIRLHNILYDQAERYRRIWFNACIQNGLESYRTYTNYHQAFVDAVVARDVVRLTEAFSDRKSVV